MRGWTRFGFVLGMCVLVMGAAASAQAASFDLTFWNTTELDNSTAKVTVDVTLGIDGNTILTITFVPGNFALTPLGIDKFGYQAASNSTTGTTSGWTFTGSGNMDGFGSFLRQADNGGGTDLTFTVVVLGNQTGVLDSASDFSAHVRFGPTSCSGFVGGFAVDTHSETGCGTAVPEPTTLALLGSGLVSLGIAGRRKWAARKLAA